MTNTFYCVKFQRTESEPYQVITFKSKFEQLRYSERIELDGYYSIELFEKKK